MTGAITVLIGRDRHWTGAPINLAALGDILASRPGVSVADSGGLLTVKFASEADADALIAAPPAGTIAERIVTFDPGTRPFVRARPPHAAAARPRRRKP